MPPTSLQAPPTSAALPPELVRRFLERYQGEAPPVAAREQLRKVLETAKANVLAARSVAGQWRRYEPLSFLNALREELLACEDEGVQELLLGFIDADVILRALQAPHVYRREDAVELIRELEPYVPDLDLRLAKRFSRDRGSGEADQTESVQRTLELIAAVNCRERTLPFLVRASRTEDRAALSKLARLAGRCAWGRGLVLALLESPDPRVRANAVEGLWESGNFPDKAQLLWRAASDPHHRVAVNALVGLVRMGVTEAEERLLGLTAHAAPEFRAAAAWGLGELGYPRFRDVLTRLYQNETGSVRRNALRALVRLKQAEARSETGPGEPE